MEPDLDFTPEIDELDAVKEVEPEHIEITPVEEEVKLPPPPVELATKSPASEKVTP